MRKSDGIRLAAKWAFGTKNILFLTGIAVAVYCSCAGGGLVSGVWQQVSEPYELVAAAGSKQITEGIVAKAGQIEGVFASTAEIEMQANLTLDGNTAEMPLSGIAPAYLQGEFLGLVFPAESAMPYAVLNEAAFRQLQDKNENGEVDDDEKLDWQKAALSIASGEDPKTTAAKICGILADGGKDPKAYISLSSAKKLAGGAYTACLIRIKNADVAQDVSDKVSALGLAVQNVELPRQADWDRKNTEAVYLFLLAGAALFYAVACLLKSNGPNAQKELEMLLLIGFSVRDIRSLRLLKNVLHCATGFAFGLAAYFLVPQFIPPDIREQVNIAAPFSVAGMLAGLGLTVLAIFICNVSQNKNLKSL